jgi:hypothetical protein
VTSRFAVARDVVEKKEFYAIDQSSKAVRNSISKSSHKTSSVYICNDPLHLYFYSVFQGFSKAKSAIGGSILSSSHVLILPQLPQKIKLTSKVVKVDSKIIISLPKIEIPETHCIPSLKLPLVNIFSLTCICKQLLTIIQSGKLSVTNNE